VTMSNELSGFVRTLQRSADLVQAWGDTEISGRSTIRELLKVDDLPVWDILAPDLALYRIPPALTQSRSANRRRSRLKRQLRAVRHVVQGAPRCDDSDCVRWPAEPVALFLGFTPYITRDILLPVVTAMKDCRDLRPVVLTRESVSFADPDGATFHSVWRHWTNDTQRDARGIARSMRRAFDTLVNDEAYRLVFSDQGRSLWADAGEAILDLGLYATDEIARYTASAHHVLIRHRPAVIVSPDVADARTRAFTLLGAASGIPTVEIQFGACGAEAIEWRFFAADRVAVWGPQSRDVLVSHNISAERVIVTGSPRHDALFDVTEVELKEFRDRFRVPVGQLAVVFGSTYRMSAYDNAADIEILRNMKRAVFAAAASLPMLTLIVKPHPLEDVNESRALASGAINIVFAEQTEDIRPLTRACDAFLTLGSASTLDAVILGKPTICPAFPGWEWSELFVDSGAVAVPRSAEEIVAALRELVEDGGITILARHAQARDTFLSEWVRDGGHGGTDRVLSLLESVVCLN